MLPSPRLTPLQACLRGARGIPVVVASAFVGLHCSTPPTSGLAGAVQGPSGSYQTIFSGMNYGGSNGVEHVIAGKNVKIDTVGLANGQLDVVNLQTGTPTTINNTPNAYVSRVAVSQAAPEAIMFLENVNDSDLTGNLLFYNLSVTNSPSAAAVSIGTSSAVQVPVDGFFFGATGSQLLFLANYQFLSGTGDLYWSNGTNPILIGHGASDLSIVFSEDRTVAVAAITVDHNGDAGFGLGQLVAINMTNGNFATLGQPLTFNPANPAVPITGVTVLVERYAQIDPLARVGGSPDIAFTLSAAGSSIAFEEDGTVKVAAYGGGTTATVTPVGPGRYPGLSPSGQKLAYYANGADKFIVCNTSSPSAPLVSVSATVTLLPQFSPDDKFVAYLEQFQAEGTPFGGDLGSVWVMEVPGQPTTSPTAYEYATDAAWHSFAFWPPATATTFPATTQMSVLADEASYSGAPSTNGTGNLLVDNPVTFMANQAASPAVGQNLAASDFALLPTIGGFDLISSTVDPTTGQEADLWMPVTQARRPGSLFKVSTNVVAGSLLSTSIIPNYAGTDASLLLADGTGTMFGGTYPMGSLLSVQGDQAYPLKTAVFAATFSNDGRILALAQKAAGSDTSSTIWSLSVTGN